MKTATIFAAVAVALLTTTVVIVDGKKLESFPVIRGVEPFVRCDVCHAMVEAAAEFRDEVVANATRDEVRVTEEAVIEASIEHLCNPHTIGGDWLRRVDWAVDQSQKAVVFRFRNAFGHCKRKCWTAADICRKLADADAADDFSGLLFRGAKPGKIQQAVCGDACRSQKKAAAKALKATTAGQGVKAAWGAEAFEPIGTQEKEVEEMMERMVLDGRSGPGMDVFSRDEMHDLRGAMAAGDFDRVQELDPTFADMDRDDFDAMRHTADAMKAADDGNESPAAAPLVDPGQSEAPPAEEEERRLPVVEEALRDAEVASSDEGEPEGGPLDFIKGVVQLMRRLVGNH